MLTNEVVSLEQPDSVLFHPPIISRISLIIAHRHSLSVQLNAEIRTGGLTVRLWLRRYTDHLSVHLYVRIRTGDHQML